MAAKKGARRSRLKVGSDVTRQLKKNEDRCPVCGNENGFRTNMELPDGSLCSTMDVECEDCGTQLSLSFGIVGASITGIDEKRLAEHMKELAECGAG